MRVIVLIAVLAPLALAGCGKKTAKSTQPDSAPAGDPAPPGPSGGTNPNNPGIVAGGGVGVVTNPGAVAGGGGGGGGVMAVRKAARRAQSLNELKQLGTMIEFMYNENGRMPTKDQVLDALKQDRSMGKILEGINEGAYILTGTHDHAGLWAYEVDAEKVGGVALIGGVAQRANAEDVLRLIR